MTHELPFAEHTQAVRKAVSTWLVSMAIRRELAPRELRAVKDGLRRSIRLMRGCIKFYEEFASGKPPIVARPIEERIQAFKGRLRYLRRRLARIEGRETPSSRLTAESIERAREYPIDSLVEVGRGHMARCVAHEDEHPSMYTKGNRAYCFSCGFSGSAIDVYMTLHGCDFREAVEALIL